MNREALEYLVFLSASADNLAKEPAMYGQLRLIDATARAIELFRAQGVVQDAALDGIAADIRENMFHLMDDRDAFNAMLARVNVSFARILKSAGKG